MLADGEFSDRNFLMMLNKRFKLAVNIRFSPWIGFRMEDCYQLRKLVERVFGCLERRKCLYSMLRFQVLLRGIYAWLVLLIMLFVCLVLLSVAVFSLGFRCCASCCRSFCQPLRYLTSSISILFPDISSIILLLCILCQYD